MMLSVSTLAAATGFGVHAAPTSVHRGHWPTLSSSQEADRMFASVAGKVTEVAVDHGQADACSTVAATSTQPRAT
jgi:hypothetical protein